MSINRGDTVRFLNDVGGGVVQKVEKGLYYILGDDGFEIPMPLEELVLIEKKAETQKQNVEELYNGVDVPDEIEIEDEVIIDNSNDTNVFLGLICTTPDNMRQTGLDIHFVNDSDQSVLYNVALVNNELATTLKAGFLEGNTQVRIKDISKNKLNYNARLCVQAILFRKANYELKAPVTKEISLNPADLLKHKNFVENDYFHENAHMVRIPTDAETAIIDSLDAKSLKKAMMEKNIKSESKQFKKNEKPEDKVIQVDLHINELLDDCRGLSNSEILTVQLDKFRDELNKAVKNHNKRIVFIHGVGNGTLKNELRKQLEKTYKYKYQDASFKEYGFGATMVFL